jgi:glycosyltransferase involved in cell wall biosynthesis
VRPRVLFLTESFYPVLGGGEQHIRTLASHLASSGMEASVLTRRSAPEWPAEEWLDGVRVLRVGPSGPARTGKYAMVPRALARLWAERGRCDVVVVRGTRVLGLPGLVAGRLLGKRVVLQPELNGEMSGEVYTWGTPLDRPAPRWLVRRLTALRNLLMRDADAFVAMSRRIREEFLEAGVAAPKVAHIPHGVDTARFRPASLDEQRELRRRLGLPAEGVLVVYSGRLLRGKGLESLVDAFGSLASASRLILVGSGAGQALSVEEELQARVSQAGLGERVVFTGRVDRVEDYLRACDVFVLPSVFEALGIALVEAAACGLACVGCRTGGIVDVIEDGRSGLLVAPGDTRELAAALARLVAEPPTRASLGREARRVAVARFDLQASIESYRALFEELTSSVQA